MEREERTELLKKIHHKLQLEDPAPAGPARKKSHKEREFVRGKFNRFQLTGEKCSQEDFFPFDITTVLYIMVQCHHGTAFCLFDEGK